MHHNLRILAGLVKAAGKLCRFDDRALRDLFRVGLHDHVRAGIIAGVHPEIVWLRDSKRQVVVVARRARRGSHNHRSKDNDERLLASAFWNFFLRVWRRRGFSNCRVQPDPSTLLSGRGVADASSVARVAIYLVQSLAISPPARFDFVY